MGAYVHRHAERVVADALADTRVVIINGARQSGKSTLVHAVTAARPDVAERRLDRTTDLQAARRDPESFVIHRGLLVIDEIQRAPELILPIKARVDDSQRPGQFLLTGSARLHGLRTLPDALVGRSETIELWPFSQGEIENEPDGFVDAAFGPDDFEQDRPKVAHEHDRSEILTRSIRGGFPEAVARDHRRRSRWFSSYVNDLIDRDVT